MNPVVTAQKMTADEFAEWVQRPENEGRHWELVRGEVVEMSRPGKRHSIICGNIVFLLNAYVRQLQAGAVGSNDPGLLLERGSDTVRGPDVVFFAQAEQYEQLNPKWIEEMPALAVEVLSPNDRPGKVNNRVSEFLRSGVRMVWIVDPESRDVMVHRPGQPPITLEGDQELTGDDMLPGFRCRVSDFFFTAAKKDEPPA